MSNSRKKITCLFGTIYFSTFWKCGYFKKLYLEKSEFLYDKTLSLSLSLSTHLFVTRQIARTLKTASFMCEIMCWFDGKLQICNRLILSTLAKTQRFFGLRKPQQFLFAKLPLLCSSIWYNFSGDHSSFFFPEFILQIWVWFLHGGLK